MPKPQTLVAALLLAAAGSSAHAADLPRFETRVGLSESAFRAANAELFAKGMRIADITVAEAKGQPVIGAIWQPITDPGVAPERVRQLQAMVFLKLTQVQLQAKGQELGAKGSALEAVDSYVAGGKTVFAASFAPPSETVASIGVFLDNGAVAAMREQANAANNDVVRMEAYRENQGLRFMPVFMARGKADIQSGGGEDSIQYNADKAGKLLLDYVPLSISMFDRGDGYPGYFGTYDKGGRSREVILFEATDAFRAKVEPEVAKGARMHDIDSFTTNGTVYYSAVLIKGKAKSSTEAYKSRGSAK